LAAETKNSGSVLGYSSTTGTQGSQHTGVVKDTPGDCRTKYMGRYQCSLSF